MIEAQPAQKSSKGFFCVFYQRQAARSSDSRFLPSATVCNRKGKGEIKMRKEPTYPRKNDDEWGSRRDQNIGICHSLHSHPLLGAIAGKDTSGGVTPGGGG
jgi:hypothetical protein